MENNNSNDLKEKIQKSNDKKLIIIGLTGIFFLGILIRILYFPYDIPIVLDGLTYFWYANDIAILNTFPVGYNFPNNGWPIFLSGQLWAPIAVMGTLRFAQNGSLALSALSVRAQGSPFTKIKAIAQTQDKFPFKIG